MNRYVLSAILALVFVAGGFGIFRFLVSNRVAAPKQTIESQVTDVRVWEVRPGDHQVRLTTQGVVNPVRMTQLSSEVGGRIVFVDPKFESGRRFKAGEVMMRIDDADYKVEVSNAESTLAQLEELWKVEDARRQQGLADWERLGNGGEPSGLVLRKPQIEAIEARKLAATAAHEKALRDLDRTKIRAPYDCRVKLKQSELGTVIQPGASLGQVESASEFEVRLPLSLEEYGFLEFEEGEITAAEVVLSGEVGREQVEWTGRILRSEDEVERRTLSVYVVAGVEPNSEAPAGFRYPPSGMFLHAKVAGTVIPDVASVPRQAGEWIEQEGGRVLRFFVARDGVLTTRMAAAQDIARADGDMLLVRGAFEDGDQVVVTRVNTANEGMKVNVVKSAKDLEEL